MAAPISAKSASWRARGADVGAEVEHDAFGLDGRPQAGDGGPLDAGHGPQDQLGHGHQGAGVAGRDGNIGLALLHGLERQPHAGALAAPHRLARLVLHLDGECRCGRCATAPASAGCWSRCGPMRGSSPTEEKLTRDAARARARRLARRRRALGRRPWRRAIWCAAATCRGSPRKYSPEWRPLRRLPTRKRADHTLLRLRNNWILAAFGRGVVRPWPRAPQPRSLIFFKAANGRSRPAGGTAEPRRPQIPHPALRG